jgi:quercetin dioxygenase-like cupin family protein
MDQTDHSVLPPQLRALPVLDSSKVDGHKLSAPGCDVLFVTGAAGTYLPHHTHDTDNVTLIVSGEVSVAANGAESRYRSGEWYHTDPGESHAIRFEADTLQVELRFAPGGG